jgi:hypothetical protein
MLFFVGLDVKTEGAEWSHRGCSGQRGYHSRVTLRPCPPHRTVDAIYGFGRPGHGWLGLMIRVMSCIITQDPGTSTPELISTTSVIRSAGR